MATITGASEALKAIKALKDKPSGIKNAMGNASVHAEAAMRNAIEVSAPTGHEADDGKRIKTGAMLAAVDTWISEPGQVSIGIKNPKGYELGQDLGWGNWGE